MTLTSIAEELVQLVRKTMRKNQSYIVTLESKVMEDIGDESGQLRPACAAMEMRLKPGEGSWSKADRPLRTKKSIDTKE